MSNTPSPDNWLSTDFASRGFTSAITCHWCDERVSEELGPCEREDCQREAEDAHRFARIVEARRARGECLLAALGCLLMAARYVAEGSPMDARRVVECIEQGHAWREQSEGWQSKVDELLGVQVVAAAAE